MCFRICVQDIFKLDFGHAARNNDLDAFFTHAADLIENLLFCCVFHCAGITDINLCLSGSARAQ
ncbi:hypothetical protein SDC9_134994 [bioreactor metagenome]|uniref:Uncharacterized protein n=1 Tax=bioreactor metagenome TaxID=1076179 RepID=A0A645DEL8_9ZZZZ